MQNFGTLPGMEFLLIAVAVIVLIGVAVIFKSRGSTGSASAQGRQGKAPRTALPESLPVTVKRSFFGRSELAFFGTLSTVLEHTPYTVFPNVRLNDIFVIGGEDKRSTNNRLRDKHVDFLIVTRDGYRPRLAIELDGASHEREVQQARDRVKDLVFRSAELTLLRLDARQTHFTSSLPARLAPHLPDLTGPVMNGVRMERARRPA